VERSGPPSEGKRLSLQGKRPPRQAVWPIEEAICLPGREPAPDATSDLLGEEAFCLPRKAICPARESPRPGEEGKRLALLPKLLVWEDARVEGGCAFLIRWERRIAKAVCNVEEEAHRPALRTAEKRRVAGRWKRSGVAPHTHDRRRRQPARTCGAEVGRAAAGYPFSAADAWGEPGSHSGVAGKRAAATS
jgi:hypothetical protein